MPQTFFHRVYAVLRTVPRGKVVTYRQLARLSGNAKASRAVGMCMKKNPDAPRTPCHRVVGSNGDLHGYSGIGGINRKKEMLIEEGVKFINNKVDLKASQWNK